MKRVYGSRDHVRLSVHELMTMGMITNLKMADKNVSYVTILISILDLNILVILISHLSSSYLINNTYI
jgi:hypothetical protein